MQWQASRVKSHNVSTVIRWVCQVRKVPATNSSQSPLRLRKEALRLSEVKYREEDSSLTSRAWCLSVERAQGATVCQDRLHFRPLSLTLLMILSKPLKLFFPSVRYTGYLLGTSHWTRSWAMLEKHRPGLCLQENYSKGRLAFNGHTTQSNLQM